MRVFFDVGANSGEDGINAIESGKYDICYAFEPHIDMVNLLRERTKEFGDKYILVDKVVSDYDGTMMFKSLNKTTVSSVLDIDTNTIELDRYPDVRRNHFEVINERKVKVITLKTFCEQNNITKIDFLHIDTQGSDLNVLKGLGDMISIVKAGRMECVDTNQLPIYLNFNNTRSACEKYLKDNKFEYHVENRQLHDINLRFKKL